MKVILLILISFSLNAQVFEVEAWKFNGHKVISISDWGRGCKERVKKAKPKNYKYIGGCWTYNDTLNPNWYKEFYIKKARK